jgi:hypothetical protein
MSNRRKFLRPPRATALTAAFMMAVWAACAPADRAIGPRATLADGSGGSARVISVVHVTQPGAAVATVGYADTTTAPVVVTDGSAGVDLDALAKPKVPNPGDQRLYSIAPRLGAALEIARDGRHVARRGRWTHEVRLADGRMGVFEFEAKDGAPVSQVTLTVNGETVVRETRSWQAVSGVWRLSSRTIAAYRGGRAVSWVEMRVESGPLRTASAVERVRVQTASVLRAGALAVADAVAPSALYGQAMTGPCGTQANTALDALKDYESSVALFGAAALSGNPFATFAAAINLLRSAEKVDDTQDRLDSCVAAA